MAITSAATPVNEAALESLGVKRGEDVTEAIVRRGPFGKAAKSARKTKLLVAEQGDIDESLRSGQHRKQAQQQHLSQRIPNLAGLAPIRQILGKS